MRLNLQSAAEHAICLFCLAAGAALFLFPTFWGEVPVRSDALFSLPPWQEARSGAGAPQPAWPADDLEIRRYVPWRVFMSHAAQTGQSLLWSPYESCGIPYLGLWRTRCLSPFSLPFYIVPLAPALMISAWMKILVAGLCAFFVARRFGVSAPMACFVGLAFEAGGAVIPRLGMPFSDSVVWLPLVVLAADRLSMGNAKGWLLMALSLTLMLLGGAPEVAVTAMLLSALFVVLRSLWTDSSLSETTSCLSLLLGAGLMAVAIAALQVIPFIEYVRHAAGPIGHEASWRPKLTDLATLILPHFFGKAADPPAVHGDAATLFYVGRAPLFMLVVWLSLRSFVPASRKTRTDAFLLAAALMTLAACVLPRYLAGIRVVRLIHPAHFVIGSAVIVALAAAEAADEWIELDADGCRIALKRFVGFGAVFVVLFAGLFWVCSGEPRDAAPDMVRQVAGLTMFSIGFLALLAATTLRPSARLMGYGLSFLTFLDLFLVFYPTLGFSTPAELFPETRFISTLQATGGRVSGTQTLERWPLEGNLIPQVYGSSGFRLSRHAQFIERVSSQPLLLRRMGSQSLLLTKKDIQGPFARVRPVLAVQHVFTSGAVLFNDLGAKPRTWMAYSARDVDTFDPEMLEPDAPPLVERVIPPSSADGPEVQPVIVEDSNTRVVIQVPETRPGILVLADSWYPGWKALVDKTPALVFPVDGFARGVLLDAGAHEVVFYYRPASWRIGVIISSAAALFFVVAAIVSLRANARARGRRL